MNRSRLAWLPGWARRRLAGPARRVSAPLLDAADLHQLRAIAQQLRSRNDPPPTHRRDAGEQASIHRGRGVEFEELRLYAPGDDVRDIDWRSTARTGRPYTKLFREEHRPVLHLAVDRGLTMRFGTRRRLKVTQAARIAAGLAFWAAEGGSCIGVTTLGPGGSTLGCRTGWAGAMAAAAQIGAACPPLHQSPGEARTLFDRQLRTLRALPAGGRLVWIGDFRLLEERHHSLLAELAVRHELSAVQVLDPAELALPDVGLAPFRDALGGEHYWLNTGDVATREAFRDQGLRRAAEQQNLFRRLGVRWRRYTTQDDIRDCLRELVHG